MLVVLRGSNFVPVTEDEVREHLGLDVHRRGGHRTVVTNFYSLWHVRIGHSRLPVSVTHGLCPGTVIDVGGIHLLYCEPETNGADLGRPPLHA